MPERPLAVFMGSSSIRLWSSLAADFPQHAVINLGRNGARLCDLVEELTDLPRNASFVILYAGSHDLHGGRSVAEVVELTRLFCGRVRQRCATCVVLLLALKPSRAKWRDIALDRAANRGLSALAAEEDAIVFVDLWSAMIAHGSPPPAEWFEADGNHPSRMCYALWADVIRPYLEKAPFG